MAVLDEILGQIKDISCNIFIIHLGKLVKGVDQIAPYTVRELGLHGNLGKVLECTDGEIKLLYPDSIPLEKAFKNYKSVKG